MGYKHILVTLDGSKFAERALEPVLEVTAQNASIHLLSVMGETRYAEIASLASAVAQPFHADEQWPPIHGINDPRAIHAREAYLKEVADWLEQLGYKVTVEVRPGSIVDTIISVARDRFELIVIATHNRSGLSKVALGSITEGVLHKAPCPMLIIPAQVSE